MIDHVAVGIDTRQEDIAAIVLDGDLLSAGELVLHPCKNQLQAGSTSVPAKDLVVVLEVPDTSRGMFGWSRARQAAVMRTVARAAELKVKLAIFGCRLYCIHAQEARAELTTWKPSLQRYDEVKQQLVKYSFDRYWNDQLKGLGIKTGRGTLLNSCHARDAFLYALWGYQVALKQPQLAEKWLEAVDQSVGGEKAHAVV
jgi:hypothetical protein